MDGQPVAWRVVCADGSQHLDGFAGMFLDKYHATITQEAYDQTGHFGEPFSCGPHRIEPLYPAPRPGGEPVDPGFLYCASCDMALQRPDDPGVHYAYCRACVKSLRQDNNDMQKRLNAAPPDVQRSESGTEPPSADASIPTTRAACREVAHAEHRETCEREGEPHHEWCDYLTTAILSLVQRVVERALSIPACVCEDGVDCRLDACIEAYAAARQELASATPPTEGGE